ncbi:hypothetical protein [Bacillus wiedmannii]|uniref:hypothetical protein n=1 Tax=Bacillus wiedmannii TaxID=1890302 RepID=UPI0021D2581E|nr:hypothetical protein [Bacillus wiedmannii]MCU5094054.1 hypothetical protein [Bacillus wiedmannii]
MITYRLFYRKWYRERRAKKRTPINSVQIRIPFTSLKYFDAYRLYQITGVYYQWYSTTLFGQGKRTPASSMILFG